MIEINFEIENLPKNFCIDRVYKVTEITDDMIELSFFTKNKYYPLIKNLDNNNYILLDNDFDMCDPFISDFGSLDLLKYIIKEELKEVKFKTELSSTSVIIFENELEIDLI